MWLLGIYYHLRPIQYFSMFCALYQVGISEAGIDDAVGKLTARG